MVYEFSQELANMYIALRACDMVAMNRTSTMRELCNDGKAYVVRDEACIMNVRFSEADTRPSKSIAMTHTSEEMGINGWGNQEFLRSADGREVSLENAENFLLTNFDLARSAGKLF